MGKQNSNKNLSEKYQRYNSDVKRAAVAYRADGKTVPLKDCSPEQVEFIAGLWRVQQPFPYTIYDVRGEEFVLHEQVARVEQNHFEFWRASKVAENCYGRYLVTGFDYIVAKYSTDDMTYWAYGETIERARAFLGIRLYDVYMDMIHSVACKKIMAQQKK